jgi:hypothetical protein
MSTGNPTFTPAGMFLDFVQDEIETNPRILPIDPVSAGKMLTWLNAMLPAFQAETVNIASRQAEACEALREGIFEGVRQHLRSAPPVLSVPSPDTTEG